MQWAFVIFCLFIVCFVFSIISEVLGQLTPKKKFEYSKVIKENEDGSFTLSPTSDGSICIGCLPYGRPLTKEDIEGTSPDCINFRAKYGDDYGGDVL
jgi:hypothetical protein